MHYPIEFSHYRGAVAERFNKPQILSQLVDIPTLLKSQQAVYLSNGPDNLVKLTLTSRDGEFPVIVKRFKRQHVFKDWYDLHYKSKAERSFIAAMYLQSHRIGTPEPIAWMDRWNRGRLLESYYLCLFESALCLRETLEKIYRETRDNDSMMELLHVLAPAVRSMHEAGFMHGDMGNQNILLPKKPDGGWGLPQFIDLNRSIIQQTPLDFDRRAFDLSRLTLPDSYRGIFKLIYCNHKSVPENLEKRELKYRRRFYWHKRTRQFRRPFRYLMERFKKPVHTLHFGPKDIWLWDDKTAQPMVTLSRKEKHRYRDWKQIVGMICHGLIHIAPILKQYRQIIDQSYQRPIVLSNRIGVALHPKPDYIQQELTLLKKLGNPPVLIRFCHHETSADWQAGLELVDYLFNQGIKIMVAVLQDRQAILHPQKWSDFLSFLIPAIADKVEHIEITHAGNRMKWGIWSTKDYIKLMKPAFALQKSYPHIKLTGPACIDFDYHSVFAKLMILPKGERLGALSHFLYVDRRGSPENKQGKFSLIEKCALLKALAQWSERCDDKVIISEVNWPIKHTGIWSPICCPYERPQWRKEQPGVSEDDYANYMLRYIVIALCSGHVDQIFWWRLSAHGYGLVDDKNNFKPRPAFTALVFFLKLLGSATFICKHAHIDELHRFEFKTPEGTIMMLWSNDKTSVDYNPSEYSQAWDRDGNSLTKISISGSPIYLLYK